MRIRRRGVLKGAVNPLFNGGFKRLFKGDAHLVKAGAGGAAGGQGALDSGARTGFAGQRFRPFNMRRTDTSETRSLRAISGTE